MLKTCAIRHLETTQAELDKLSAENPGQFNEVRAAFLKKFIWPQNSTVKIGFITKNPKNLQRNTYASLINTLDAQGVPLQVDPLQRVVDDMPIVEAVKTVIKERVQPLVGLNLIFVDDYHDADVRIDFNRSEGAWSLIGTECLGQKDRDKATMNLGWFDVATTMHEFGHVLSCIHEHQNPNGNTIQWNTAAVYQWANSTQGWDKETTNVNILTPYKSDQINGGEFDPDSIMLYFYPPQLTTDNTGTRQNLRLSSDDVKYWAQLYPGGAQTPELFYLTVYNEPINSPHHMTPNAGAVIAGLIWRAALLCLPLTLLKFRVNIAFVVTTLIIAVVTLR